MWLLSSAWSNWLHKDWLHTAKMHTFHGSEVLTAATATEVTLNGSKQAFCFYSEGFGIIKRVHPEVRLKDGKSPRRCIGFWNKLLCWCAMATNTWDWCQLKCVGTTKLVLSHLDSRWCYMQGCEVLWPPKVVWTGLINFPNFWPRHRVAVHSTLTVSYTHLTLPTIYSV